MSELHRTFHDADLDTALVETLAAQQLDARRVDDTDRAQTDAWVGAVARGFLDGEPTDTQRQQFFERNAYRRKLGVYDPAGVQPEVPVATFVTWGAELTVPGETVVPACAVSSVTVAPTHRRRGLLRTVMLGELRTAAASGFPLAMLTVSESTIYGRFGYGPAAAAASWTIDVRRAGWRVPEPEGRVDFVTREHGRTVAAGLHDRARIATPGEIDMPGADWDRTFGLRPDAQKAEQLRVAQYRSAAGEVEGLVVYRVTENEEDYAASSLDVVLLLAATDGAYAGLWRFLLSMDLIGTITAHLLSVDEPLWWMIANQRAAKIEVNDHQYLRILDVAKALEARRYDVADAVLLEVEDPLGFADGRFLLTTSDDGSARVVPAEESHEAPVARLGIAELSSIYLGGVSPATLARAGRIHADDPARLTRLFASSATPRLSFWY